MPIECSLRVGSASEQPCLLVPAASVVSPPLISPHLNPLALFPRALLGSICSTASIAPQKLDIAPVISSRNLKVNSKVPSSVSISNRPSGKSRFGVVSVTFHSCIKFGVQERSERTSDFSENQMT
ncbi:hypothetical protein Q9233_000290 [Columba guinea]|nr:hypothetical protein Q9233_000290 [Columba guinea]